MNGTGKGTQGVLNGFEEYSGYGAGLQEKATKELIAHFVGDRDLNAEGRYICKSMLSIARNIDAQNERGREISRNMTTLLTWFQELKELYPEAPQLDSDVADFVAEAKA